MSKMKTIEPPAEFIAGTAERRGYYPGEPMVLQGIDEMQCLRVPPQAFIEKCGHDKWEVWVDVFHKVAYVCLIGEEHKLVNYRKEAMVLFVVIGHIDYTYEELAKFFFKWDFSVFSVAHAALIVND